MHSLIICSRQIPDTFVRHTKHMKTPIEQILEGFEGITLYHFIPVFLVLIPVIILEVRRRRNPIRTSRTKVWVKGKGFQPTWTVDTRDKDAVAEIEGALGKSFLRK